MEVLEVGGDTDFRSLPANREHQRFTQGHYVWPGDAAQRLALKVPPAHPLTLEVNKRNLRALASNGRLVMFAFDDLCEQPTAVIDYLQLAQQYDAWIIEGLDDLSECSLAAQQRFVNLVDVLYDQDCQVTVIGQRRLEESLGGTVADLMRTRSRLGQLHQVGPEDFIG
ncbi:Cell division protein ZapE [compost metagenome]